MNDSFSFNTLKLILPWACGGGPPIKGGIPKPGGSILKLPGGGVIKFVLIIGGGTVGENAAGGIPGEPVKFGAIGGGFLGSFFKKMKHITKKWK